MGHGVSRAWEHPYAWTPSRLRHGGSVRGEVGLGRELPSHSAPKGGAGSATGERKGEVGDRCTPLKFSLSGDSPFCHMPLGEEQTELPRFLFRYFYTCHQALEFVYLLNDPW